MSKVTEYRDTIRRDVLLAGRSTAATCDTEAARPAVADGDNVNLGDSDQVLMDLWERYMKLWQELDRLGREDDTPDVHEKIAACGEIADNIERQILSRPASGLSGIAVKLRLILNVAPPPDHWDTEHEMIASALADAERLAGASWAQGSKKSA